MNPDWFWRGLGFVQMGGSGGGLVQMVGWLCGEEDWFKKIVETNKIRKVGNIKTVTRIVASNNSNMLRRKKNETEQVTNLSL